MNHCVPDWSMEEGSRSFHDLFPSANHRKSAWSEDDLVELLWQDGHVIMQSQTHRKTMTPPSEVKQCQEPEPALKSGERFKNSTNTVQEEPASWVQYPIGHSFEKEFCPDFYELPTAESTVIDQLEDVVAEGDKVTRQLAQEGNNIFSESMFEQSDILQFTENMMPPQSEVVASLPQTTCAGSGGYRNFACFSRLLKADSGTQNEHHGDKRLENQIQGEVGEPSSMMTKESSICGSNQVHNLFDVSCGNTIKVVSGEGLKEDAQTMFNHERDHTDTHETTITSSSGGSGCTVGRVRQQSAITRIHKRKERDADESEFQSEEADDESMETNREVQRSASAKRRRAAEVHNLSERRRRDRINEKMKALQELIPHCNKSDKASMLDEAIEYLKSLQLQVQIMWMRSGMPPMMFPGVHHYMSQMGMGMGHGSLPSIHGPIQFPRVPLFNLPLSSNLGMNQASFCPASDIRRVCFQNQMQNAHIPRPYAGYIGFPHMQPSPQMMNLYAYGSQLMQQNQTALAAGSRAPCVGGAPSENIQNGSTG